MFGQGFQIEHELGKEKGVGGRIQSCEPVLAVRIVFCVLY